MLTSVILWSSFLLISTGWASSRISLWGMWLRMLSMIYLVECIEWTLGTLIHFEQLRWNVTERFEENSETFLDDILKSWETVDSVAEFVTANLNGTSLSDFSSFLYLSVNMLDPSSGSYRLFRITIFLALSNHCYIFDRIFLQSLENSG